MEKMNTEILELLGFANYCLEMEVIEPTFGHVLAYIKQGGWDYYRKHIENANGVEIGEVVICKNTDNKPVSVNEPIEKVCGTCINRNLTVDVMPCRTCVCYPGLPAWKAKERETRENGFYWIRLSTGDWIIAEHNNIYNGWLVPGDWKTYKKDQVIEIDERRIERTEQ